MIRAISHTSEGSSQTEPLFEIGQLVRHHRYGYRGVVVEFDRQCMASQHWYMSNQTQPDRNQPWYHVLVDGSAATTYAAQDSLISDSETAPVIHPLVDLYFSDFQDGRYVRNDTPWQI